MIYTKLFLEVSKMLADDFNSGKIDEETYDLALERLYRSFPECRPNN